jgi:hypothetical protein
VPTWERFVELVSHRFSPPARSNPLGKLQRVGSVAEYRDQFLKHLARCNNITEQQQISIYMADLGEPLCINVKI